MENREKFISVIAQAEIAASGTLELDLNELRTEHGHNFNTITITNTDAGGDVSLFLDGEEVAFVTSNNGSFSIDWETGINFNFVTLENHNAGAVIAADKVKVFVGRTGHNGA